MAKVGERGECGESVVVRERRMSCEGAREMFECQTIYVECIKNSFCQLFFGT